MKQPPNWPPPPPKAAKRGRIVKIGDPKRKWPVGHA